MHGQRRLVRNPTSFGKHIKCVSPLYDTTDVAFRSMEWDVFGQASDRVALENVRPPILGSKIFGR
jgi:hypothetical protein